MDDPFCRQRFLADWNNELMEQQSCLVLGVGGLGCSVAMALARLGVRRIVLVDNDVVEVSNLNRQILFSTADVGNRKAEVAAASLSRHAVPGHTEIVGLHLDVLEDWGRVVQLAKECSVVFNNVDIGGAFDYAVLSLCKRLGIPYAAGSSYCRTWIVEFFSAKQGESSFSLENKDGDPAVFQRLNNVEELKCLDFIQRDPMPSNQEIGSNVLVCVSAGIMTVNAWIQHLMGLEMPNYSKVDIAHYWKKDESILAWPPPRCDSDF